MSWTRRKFLCAAGTAAVAGTSAALHGAVRPVSERRCRKALKLGMVAGDAALAAKLALVKRLGFDGIELDSPNGFALDEVLRARDAVGLPIHGVVDSQHWQKPLAHPDEAVRAAGVAALEQALRDAKAYGASTVLLVPAVVDKDVSYAAAWDRSQACIRRALPLAGELGVKIALENVWNQFLLSPLEFARYLDELDDPNIGAYFDVGNVVRFGWPEHWIEVLGERILKVDVKEYSRKRENEAGPWAGFGVELLDGDCDWPAVMRALDRIGYCGGGGWFTAEVRGGGEERLADIAARMDRIFAV